MNNPKKDPLFSSIDGVLVISEKFEPTISQALPAIWVLRRVGVPRNSDKRNLLQLLSTYSYLAVTTEECRMSALQILINLNINPTIPTKEKLDIAQLPKDRNFTFCFGANLASVRLISEPVVYGNDVKKISILVFKATMADFPLYIFAKVHYDENIPYLKQATVLNF